jgi:hypothetical protein
MEGVGSAEGRDGLRDLLGPIPAAAGAARRPYVQWSWFHTYERLPERTENDLLVISWDIAMKATKGRRGWFYEQWTSGEGWERYRVPAESCPRIPKEFLDDELKQLGPMLFAQEYQCEFVDDGG